jgi:hypothetical protein
MARFQYIIKSLHYYTVGMIQSPKSSINWTQKSYPENVLLTMRQVVPCHHNMVRPRFSYGGDGFQVWRVQTNIYRVSLYQQIYSSFVIYFGFKLPNNPFSVIIQPDYLLIIWSPIWTFSVNHIPCYRYNVQYNIVHKTAHVTVDKRLLFCEGFGTMWTVTK